MSGRPRLGAVRRCRGASRPSARRAADVRAGTAACRHGATFRRPAFPGSRAGGGPPGAVGSLAAEVQRGLVRRLALVASPGARGRCRIYELALQLAPTRAARERLSLFTAGGGTARALRLGRLRGRAPATSTPPEVEPSRAATACQPWDEPGGPARGGGSSLPTPSSSCRQPAAVADPGAPVDHAGVPRRSTTSAGGRGPRRLRGRRRDRLPGQARRSRDAAGRCGRRRTSRHGRAPTSSRCRSGPLLRGELVTPDGVLFLETPIAGGARSGTVSERPLWAPATKVHGRYLSTWLACDRPACDSSAVTQIHPGPCPCVPTSHAALDIAPYEPLPS